MKEYTNSQITALIDDQLRSMADMAPDERTRQEINRIASRMEGR